MRRLCLHFVVMNPIDLTAFPTTDPTSIYHFRDALYAPDLLIVGLVELDLFTWLNTRGSASKAEVCANFQTTERPTDVMLTLFTAMGCLEREGDVFRVSEMGREHLVKGSPWFLGPYFASLRERPVCKDYLSVLRSGKPAGWGGIKDEKAWAQAMEKPDFAESFTAAMDCRGVFMARAMVKAVNLSGFSSFLDIAGGSGIYACSAVAGNPGLRASVFEKSPVDRVASQMIARRGFSDRISVVTGDMFAEPLPGGHDVHLFSNVLHDWDIDLVEMLVEKSFAALEPGGMLLVHDAHLNADKTGPLHVAEYSALLMHSTEGKCYSVREMDQFLTAAGFIQVDWKPGGANRSVMTARKPK